MSRRATSLIAGAMASVAACGLFVDTSGLSGGPSSASDGGASTAADAVSEPSTVNAEAGDAGAADALRQPDGAVVFPENGHAYLVVVSGSITWEQARSRATELGGHLATITSAAENDFVWARVRDAPGAFGGFSLGPWLGGVQDPKGVEPDGGWGWDTGEPWAFTSWRPGAPNEDTEGEDYLAAYGSANDAIMLWVDLPVAAAEVRAFVVEFD